MKAYRIGVLGCFYECAELLPDVLAPWAELKAQGYPVTVAAINAHFKEYAELGYPDNDNATRDLLRRSSVINNLCIAQMPLSEAQARSYVLEKLLEAKVDLVWMLDGDEVYTAQQIRDILAYIEKTPQFDYYHVNFDNRIFGLPFDDTFHPPRIFRTDRRGGLTGFADDNTPDCGDGRGLYESVPGIIPKRVAHVLHHTWQLADALKKIRYQERHFGFSMFRVAPGGSVSFNAAFYAHLRRPAPTLREGRIIAAPLTPLRIVARLLGRGEADRRALTSILSTLLAIERQNDYEIELLVQSPWDARREVEELAELMPFAVRFVGPEEVAEQVDFVVESSEVAEGPHALLARIRARFPVLLGAV